MFEYEKKNEKIILTRYTGDERRVEAPERIDALPVCALGDYIFANTPITHLTIPSSVKKVGRYAFYNCNELKELSFTGALKDVGAGAFTGCHHIRKIAVSLGKDEATQLKDILAEIPEEICVDYTENGEFARLMFPEFFEEGIENTPARIIEHHTHGSGMHYRNCFVRRKLQFAEYDRCFSYAKSQERFAFVIELALGRLQYPYQLSDAARREYADYLEAHFEEALAHFTVKKSPEPISFLMNYRHQAMAPAPVFDFEL